jgi:outer membrane protein assembly factor BamB
MSKNIITILSVGLLFVAQSCTSIKSTFKEEYTTKIKFKPDQYAIMSTDNQSIFLIGTTSNFLSSGTKISKVNAADGQTEWSEGVHKLGDMEKIPGNIIVIDDKNIALMFAIKPGSTFKSPEYKISAFDMKTKKQLWSRSEKSRSYSMGGLYLPQNNSFMIQTPDGMQAFDISTGQILWNIDGLSTRLNIGRLSLRLDGGNVNFIYIESMERLLMEVKGKVTLINPFTGKFEWQLEEEIGSPLDADIFDDAGKAVFYGRVLSNRNQDAARPTSGGGSTLSTLASRAISGSGRGAQNSPIMLVDLHTGRITWQNNFYSNGQKQLLITHNKLLVTGIVSYAFDLKSGEKTWQNVTDERLRREGVLGMFAEFTGIDYTSDRHRTRDAIVIDNSVFVVFPEILEQGGNRNHISIRLYDFVTGEMLWKTEPERLEVREMFFEKGILFVIANGRFARASKMIALDPYSGKKLYEIDSRETFGRNLIFTEQVIYTLSVTGSLSVYDIRTGVIIERERLGRFVVDVVDMQDKLMVVYQSNRGQTIAFHDRNTFNILGQVDVPFYSKNIFMANNKLFMVQENPNFKGLIHLDFDKLEVYDHLTISNSGTKKSKIDNRNVILDPYKFIISNDASHLYLVRKKKLVRYSIKS